jgi:hypothetical protein
MRIFLTGLVAAFALCTMPAVAHAAPPVDLELATEPSFPLGGTQSWLELFKRLGQTSIRIRQAEPGERESMQNEGTAEQPQYHVIGILTRSNRLRLPGGEFGLSDRARIGDWITRLRDEGAAGPVKTAAFGLTEEQLVAFHDKLAATVPFTTRGRRAGDVARDIVRLAAVEFTVSEAARQAFQGDELLEDELRSLSCGTALAAAIRPLGLVMRPEKAVGGKIRLHLCDVREVEESWPIGWPLKDIPVKASPKLMESLKVTIANRPLTEALEAIQPRVEVPFLFDRNALARKRIDPGTAKVSYTKERTSYFDILKSLFFQAGLTCELRADEAEKPFLWISAR